MKYTTLQEYFYKLQNTLYLLVLAPLLIFIYLLLRPSISSEPQPQSMIVIGFISLVAVADWTMASIISRDMLLKVREQLGLGIKLEKYFQIIIIRFAMTSAGCVVLALGFFYTNSPVLSMLFGVGLILFFIFWPRPANVCRDLQLKGDEREMVLNKKDRL